MLPLHGLRYKNIIFQLTQVKDPSLPYNLPIAGGE